MLCLPTEFTKKYSAGHGINLCWKASYTPSPRKHNRTCAREISLAKHTSWNIHEGFVSHTKKEKERAVRERERDIYIFAEKRRRRRAGRFARRQTSRRRHKIGAPLLSTRWLHVRNVFSRFSHFYSRFLRSDTAVRDREVNARERLLNILIF